MTLSQTAETPSGSTERVSDLVQKLVAAATAEVEAAAQRTRAQVQVEIAQLQRTIDRLRAELQAERDKLTTATEELTLARASEALLQAELDAERIEKARFAATLETVRLLVTAADSDLRGPDPTPLPDTHIAEAHDELSDGEPAIDPEFAEFQSDDLTPSNRTYVSDRPDLHGTSHGDTTSHLAQLLGQIEEIHRSDLESAEDPSDVVGRLVANLAYARDAFARRLDSIDGGDALFDRHVARLLETRSSTAFGRHLAMALRLAASDRDRAPELEKEAS
jgi:hypothetical protein